MSRYRNFGLFMVLAAVWGTAFLAIKVGLDFFPPITFAAVRYDVAAVLMLAYTFYAVDDPVPTNRKQWTAIGIGAVFLIAGYHAFLFVGETDPAVTSASAAVIVSLSPILTTVFARAFLPRERLTAAGVAGLLLGLVGVAVLSQPDPNRLLAGGFVAKLFVFGAAMSFALGTVLTRRFDADLSIETLESWSMLVGAALLHVVAVGVGESPGDIAWTTDGIVALAYLSVVASAVGFLIFFDLLERLGPIEINLVSYVAPVYAALSGWAVRGETPTAATAIGFVLIFGGFLLVKRSVFRNELPRLRALLRK